MAPELAGDGSSIDSALRVEDIAGITVSEWVRHVAVACGFDGSLTDDEIEFLLMEKTAYPVAGTVFVQGQLSELFERMKEEHKDE